MAITLAACSSAAACNALRPTAPQPITATCAPASTRASRLTAPTPVMTPQPSRHARSNGISGGNRDGARFGNDEILGVRRDDREMVQPAAVQAQARRAVEQVAARLLAREGLAQDRLAALAIEAVAAVRIPRGDDVIARPHQRHRRADRLDDAGALVAEHDRQRIREAALDDLEVGVAQAAGAVSHQHVAGRERRQRRPARSSAARRPRQHRRAKRRCRAHGPISRVGSHTTSAGT